jgi:hypothetical protein
VWKTRSGRWLKRKPGRRKGKRASPRARAACRANPWRHGLRAVSVTRREVTRYDLERKIPGAAGVFDAYTSAVSNGDVSELDPISARALTESEVLRRRLVDDVGSRGVVVEEDLFGADGRVVGSRLKAHPALEAIGRFSEQLGHTAADTMLTRKSRGEGFRDLAIAARLARDELLRAADKSLMALPPPRKP